MIFKNYDVFYKIDEEDKTVQILEIKRHAQNQPSLNSF